MPEVPSEPKAVSRELLRQIGIGLPETDATLPMGTSNARISLDGARPLVEPPHEAIACIWCGRYSAHVGSCPMEAEDIPELAMDDPSTLGAEVPDAFAVMPEHLQEALNLWISTQIASIPDEDGAFLSAIEQVPSEDNAPSEALTRIADELHVIEDAGVTPDARSLRALMPDQRQAVLQALGYVTRVAKARLVAERLLTEPLPETGDALFDALTAIRLYRTRFLEQFRGLSVSTTLQ